MKRKFLLILVLLVIVQGGLAQTEKYSSPVKWERYTFDNSGISLLLPKIPIKQGYSSPCFQTEFIKLYFYAEGAVYRFTMTRKLDEKIPRDCTQRGKFSRSGFAATVKRFSRQSSKYQATISKAKGLDVRRFATSTEEHWIYDDLSNDRWFDFSVFRDSLSENDGSEFLSSLEFEKSLSAIRIIDGAKQILGDQTMTTENSVERVSAYATERKLRIVEKPRPGYTALARRKNQQGTTMLAVTFLANGGIGDVEVIERLQYGLTENAIRAAKKMAFLPEIRNRKAVTVIKQVQYSFTLY